MEPLTVIGLMSGTSLDGIDAAILSTDGEGVADFGATVHVPYDPTFRRRLRGVLGLAPEDAGDVDSVAGDLTLRHADAVRRLLLKAARDAGEVDLIGFHGHTILHRPESGLTRQIGDGAALAAETGISVVDDFRRADMADGGQGAPFAPLYHAALAQELEKPVAVLNIGGVANVTWIGDGALDLLAFDTGPGNALIDDWVAGSIGRLMDEGGRLARAGSVNDKILAVLLKDGYFDRPPPKSLDRDDFQTDALADLSAADGAATLTAFTAESIKRAEKYFPKAPKRWLVAGGGRHNHTLMAVLANTLDSEVVPVEKVGWQGDFLEAQAFAFLAVRSLRGLALSLPTTTGVNSPMTGGVLHQAPAAPVPEEQVPE